MALGNGLNSLIAPGSGEKKVGPDHTNQAPSSFSPHFDTQKKEAISEKIFSPVTVSQERLHTPSPQHLRQEAVFHIEVEKIHPNPYQPRKFFNDAEIQELSDSIKEFGVLQPLVVTKVIKETPNGTAVEYQLIAGERRFLASKRAGLPRVPAIIKKGTTPKMKLEIALIENIQRSNLNPLESARAYARLQDEFGLTQKDIAVRVGKSRESVANTMRLLNLPTNIQTALEEGKINESQARNLLSFENPDERQLMFTRILSGETTARIMRERISKTRVPDPAESYWRKKVEERLGLPVDIVKRGTRGKITIQFYSDEEFNSVLKGLLGDMPD